MAESGKGCVWIGVEEGERGLCRSGRNKWMWVERVVGVEVMEEEVEDG